MKSLHSQHGEVRIGRDLDELSRQAASLFCDLAQTAIGATGRFAVALSGGVMISLLSLYSVSPRHVARGRPLGLRLVMKSTLLLSCRIATERTGDMQGRPERAVYA